MHRTFETPSPGSTSAAPRRRNRGQGLATAHGRWEVLTVAALLVFLLIVALLFGLGVAVHALLWIAIIALIVWVIGFAFRPSGGRWYYW